MKIQVNSQGKAYITTSGKALVAKEGQSDYITDGLVFQLDGINKGNTEGTWTDLISGTAYEKVGSPIALSDGWQFSAGNYFRSDYTTSDIVRENRASTLELIYTGDPANAYIFSGYNFAFGKGASQYILTSQSGRKMTVSPVSLIPTTGTNKIVQQFGYSSFLRVNGENINWDTDNFYIYIPTKSTIGARITRQSEIIACTGTLHAIRVYNRALSGFELSINHEIDKKRFNLSE